MTILMILAGVACIMAACVHGYLGETRLIAPASFPNRQARRLVSAIWQFSTLAWICSGLFIAFSPWLLPHGWLVPGVALACLPVLYGIVLNAAITRGRHFGWKIFGGIVITALAGAWLQPG